MKQNKHDKEHLKVAPAEPLVKAYETWKKGGKEGLRKMLLDQHQASHPPEDETNPETSTSTGEGLEG